MSSVHAPRADVKRTPAPYSGMMALAEHLERPHRRGELIAGSHTGAAGGAACGDLVRLSVAVEGERVRGRRIRRPRLRLSRSRPASAAVALVAGRRRCSTRPVSDPRRSPRSWAGSPRPSYHAAELAADALHRALGAAARADATLERAPGRVLVAMSGGVDSAVAALLCGSAGRGRDARAVVGPRERRRAQLLLAAGGPGRAGARARARAAAPLARPARGVPRRASSSRGSPATPRG